MFCSRFDSRHGTGSFTGRIFPRTFSTAWEALFVRDVLYPSSAITGNGIKGSHLFFFFRSLGEKRPQIFLATPTFLQGTVWIYRIWLPCMIFGSGNGAVTEYGNDIRPIWAITDKLWLLEAVTHIPGMHIYNMYILYVPVLFQLFFLVFVLSQSTLHRVCAGNFWAQFSTDGDASETVQHPDVLGSA